MLILLFFVNATAFTRGFVDFLDMFSKMIQPRY